MTRAFRLSLVGSLVLVTLAGCGRGWLQFAQREPWRAEAERACLSSGTVREGVHITRAQAISGPGVCGAEYPLKVAAFGDGNSALGYVSGLRPPASIPNVGNQPRWPGAQAAPTHAPPQPSPPPQYPAPHYSPQPVYQGAQPGGPISLTTPGAAQSHDIDAAADIYEERPPRYRQPTYPQPTYQQPTYQQPTHQPPTYQPPRQHTLPTLGPPRAPQTAAIGPVAVKPTATLACPMVSALDRWIADSVQPSAMRWFGSPVAEIRQISAYSCRGMNGNSNARISEHAFGNALDIASFTLADGRSISVKNGWRGRPEEQGFLRDVQGAACQQFSTVLAPGSNVYHYDHIHVDLMRRSSGRSICQPGAVSGEMIAARARGGRHATAREPQFTGSIGRAGRPQQRAFSDDDWIEDESNLHH